MIHRKIFRIYPKNNMAKILKTRIRKNTKYLEFIEPRAIRQPKKLQDFAKEIGIHKDTLTNWKCTGSFWEDVKTERMSLMYEWVGDTIVALNRRVMKYGRAAEAKLLLQLAGVLGCGKKSSAEIAIRVEDTLTEAKKEEIMRKVSKIF